MQLLDHGTRASWIMGPQESMSQASKCWPFWCKTKTKPCNGQVIVCCQMSVKFARKYRQGVCSKMFTSCGPVALEAILQCCEVAIRLCAHLWNLLPHSRDPSLLCLNHFTCDRDNEACQDVLICKAGLASIKQHMVQSRTGA